MDLRLGPLSGPTIFPRQYSGEGLRAVLEEQAPRAEEMAARYVEQTRPVWSWLAAEWRRGGGWGGGGPHVGPVAARHVWNQRHRRVSAETCGAADSAKRGRAFTEGKRSVCGADQG